MALQQVESAKIRHVDPLVDAGGNHPASARRAVYDGAESVKLEGVGADGGAVGLGPDLVEGAGAGLGHDGGAGTAGEGDSRVVGVLVGGIELGRLTACIAGEEQTRFETEVPERNEKILIQKCQREKRIS